jgi:hypothetical protein
MGGEGLNLHRFFVFLMEVFFISSIQRIDLSDVGHEILPMAKHNQKLIFDCLFAHWHSSHRGNRQV